MNNSIDANLRGNALPHVGEKIGMYIIKKMGLYHDGSVEAIFNYHKSSKNIPEWEFYKEKFYVLDVKITSLINSSSVLAAISTALTIYNIQESCKNYLLLISSITSSLATVAIILSIILCLRLIRFQSFISSVSPTPEQLTDAGEDAKKEIVLRIAHMHAAIYLTYWGTIFVLSSILFTIFGSFI